MRLTPFPTFLPLLLGGGLAVAQSPSLQTSLKLGLTPVLGNAGDQRSSTGIALGAEVAYGTETRAAFAGLEYRTLRAVQRETTRFGTGYYRAADGTVKTGQITPYALGPDGYPKPDPKYDSVDVRRNLLSGFSLSVGYRVQVVEDWKLFLQGGLNLSALQSRQEVNAYLRVVGDRSKPGPADPLGKEDAFTQVQETRVKPGAFLGLRAPLSPSFFAELNLTVLGYADANYLPFSYTGQAPRTERISHGKTLLECHVGFRF